MTHSTAGSAKAGPARCRTAATSTSSSRAEARATAAALAGALASPRPGHLPFLACLELGTLVRPTTLVVNKSTLEGETLLDDDLGRCAARHRPGRARRRRRRRPGRGRRARARCCWSPSGSIRQRTTRRAVQRANREAVRAAHRGRGLAALRGRRPSRSPRAARTPPTRTTRAAELRIAAVETRRYAFPLEPPFRAAWDPVPRTRLEATLVIVRTDDGCRGLRERRPVSRTRPSSQRLLVGVDPLRTEVVREICETVDFHGGRPWTAEVAVWDLVGRVARPAALAAPRRTRRTGSSPTPRAASPSAADERARRVVALRDARRPRGQDPLPGRRLAPRRRASSSRFGTRSGAAWS